MFTQRKKNKQIQKKSTTTKKTIYFLIQKLIFFNIFFFYKIFQHLTMIYVLNDCHFPLTRSNVQNFECHAGEIKVKSAVYIHRQIRTISFKRVKIDKSFLGEKSVKISFINPERERVRDLQLRFERNEF